MSDRLRLLAALMALLIPATLLASWSSAERGSERDFDTGLIPTSVAGREVTAVDFWPEEILAKIEPDAYILRRYEDGVRPPLWAYVAFYKGVTQLGAGAHSPELCYPAQGWEILQQTEVRIDVGGGAELRARLMQAYQNRAQETVLFWIQPAFRWPSNPAIEQLLRIADALEGTDQYAFVRLSMPKVTGHDSEADLIEFARALARKVQIATQRPGPDGTVAEGIPFPFPKVEVHFPQATHSASPAPLAREAGFGEQG